MSDQKKNPGVFPQRSGQARDAIPTADEGDALLDMLFDDAPRESNEGAAPDVEATPIPGQASSISAALPPTKPPPPLEADSYPMPASRKVPVSPRAEVVSPPGWATPPQTSSYERGRDSGLSPRAPAPTLPEPDMDDVATRAFTGADLAARRPLADLVDDADEDDYGPSEPVERALIPDEPATAVAADEMDVEEIFDAAEDELDPGTESIAEEPFDPESLVEGGTAIGFVEEEASLPAELDDEGTEAEPAPISADVALAGGASNLDSESAVVTLSARPAADADLEDEQHARHILSQQPELAASFLARAQWLREEASLTTDKVARARLFLTVSELFAMVGEDQAAAEAAGEAHHLAPSLPLVSRQFRAALAGTAETDRVSEALEGEIRHSPTPAGRAHSGWLGAELARIVQRDDALAKRRTEQAMRASPADPRPSVQRFVEAAAELPDPATLTKIKPSDPEALASLSEAFTTVASLRGAPPPKGGSPGHIVEVALAARSALTGGDPEATAVALGALRDTSFRAGACWLTAVLAGARPVTRGRAISALREISAHSTTARRTLAALSIEAGEAVDPRDSTAFGPLDRVALAALDAARPDPGGLASREMLASILDDAAVVSEGTDAGVEVSRITGPVIAALLQRGEQRLSRLRFVHAGAQGVRAAALLGRILASVRTSGAESREVIDQAITELVQSADTLRPHWSAFVRGLGLELDIDASSADRVAQTIATWGSDGERPADASGVLVAALLAELSRETERARISYAEIHREDASSEAVVRASAGQGDPGTFARMLKEHAEQLPEGPRRAVLLSECAIRFSSLAQAALQDAGEAGSPEGLALAEEADVAAKAAAELAPEIPIAGHLGEIGARARGDQAALVEWLRFRRESSEDPIDRAHDLTREALLVSDGESTAASSLLETALSARSNDFALRDLYERLSPEPTADRAAWREARLDEVPESEATRLAVEAALEYERTGDLEAAARCAKIAQTRGENELAPIAAYRFALSGFGTAELVEALMPEARESDDPARRMEIYERLAELDERGREDAASGLLFRRTILEENPAHIRTLRRVTSTLMAGGRTEELEPFAMELARNLEGGEAVAYAAVATRLRTQWEETAEPVAIAYAQSPRPLWSIRQMVAHARSRGDQSVVARCEAELMALTDRPNERATLALRAAEARVLLGDLEGARQLLQEAIGLVPEHLVVRLTLADVLEASSEFAAAATQLETASESLSDPAFRLTLDMRAAHLWQDGAKDAERARAALERIAVADPNNADAFERLRQLYVAAGARAELAELLGRRVESVQDPAERVEMEVMRGRALAEVGDAEAAKRALAAALDANPDHLEALQSFSELCMSEGDYDGAEQALIRLARLASDPDRQVEIYMRLGELYDELLPNDERAELAYQEVLKRRPTDEPARAKLIGLYRRTSQMPRAIEEQNVLVNAAESPDDKCQRTVELAEILEESGELKKAESTLVVARKAFPKSDSALRALVKFYQRTGQAPSAAILLDRAVADARRALGTGRFETFLFETLATAAELRNRADAAAVAHAAVHAIDGQAVELPGVGARAGDAVLDELLAPEVMTPAFRDLLQRTGPMLDAAFPYDLDGVRATAAPSHSDVAEQAREVAGAYGLPQIQLLVSNVLGQVCVPVRSHPPTIIMGQALASQEPSTERTFLLHRAMKVLQANAAVFARTAPIDLWPLLAAYLRVFSPQFSPQGVDAARFSEAFGRLSRTMPQGLGHDAALLAADVIGTIGNRASTLNAAINGWGSRAGLLAVGDSNVALTGIAWAGGNANGPPESGKDRLTWIGRNAEARDLVIFSVSDAYVDARARLGLG